MRVHFRGLATLLSLGLTLAARADHSGPKLRPDLSAGKPTQRELPPQARKNDRNRIVLPVITHVQVAREALEEQVRLGNIPADAVEPLLSKIAPVIDKIAERINAAQGDKTKIRDIVVKAPTLQLTYQSGDQTTQIVAKVLSPDAAPAVAQGSVTPGAPAMERKELDWNAMDALLAKTAKVEARPDQGKRPIADGGVGNGSTIGIAGPGGVSTASISEEPTRDVSSALPAVPKASVGIRTFVSEWVGTIKEGEGDGEAGSERWPDNSPRGFALLKPPKLSPSSSLMRFPASEGSFAPVEPELAEAGFFTGLMPYGLGLFTFSFVIFLASRRGRSGSRPRASGKSS